MFLLLESLNDYFCRHLRPAPSPQICSGPPKARQKLRKGLWFLEDSVLASHNEKQLILGLRENPAKLPSLVAASAFPQQQLLQRLCHVDVTKPEMVQAESLPCYNKQGSALRTAARRLLVSARDQKPPQKHLSRSLAAWRAKNPSGRNSRRARACLTFCA